MTIHCPSCGHESSPDQKFCRKCGFNLEPISKLVSAGADSGAESDRVENDRTILRRMYRWMMWGFLVMLIGVVLLVSGKAFDLPKFLGPLSSFLLIGGAATAGYGLLAALRDGISSPKKLPRAPGNKELPPPPTTELPEQPVPIPIPSVTERTTQLIGEQSHERS